MTTTNLQAFLVGGAVRDELLGRPVADRDWVVIGATVEQLLNQGFQQIGRGFPCFLHPQTKEEYALARTERKSGKGHHGFICEFGPHITLEEDLSRRDLTINAIAKSADGRYIDPYGGRDDLKAGILRHVSAAFIEDPLRVLRVARFAARYAHLGFTVHPQTLDLMRELVAQDELSQLTAERVWKEMSRALTEASPDVFFRVLRACGALKVILPELDKLFGIPQPPEHHPEIDTGEHVMLCIDIAAKQFNTLIVTWAVLLHDLGKGLTPEHLWPKHVKHEINGVPLAAQVCNRFRVPREFLSLALLVSEYHLQCHRINEMGPKSVLRLLHALDVFRRPQRLTYFVQACEADARGRTGFENKPYPQAERLIACAKAADEINVKPLLAAGYEGPELIEQINQKRLQAIAQTLNSSKG